LKFDQSARAFNKKNSLSAAAISLHCVKTLVGFKTAKSVFTELSEIIHQIRGEKIDVFSGDRI
jgi:hypothetical protein